MTPTNETFMNTFKTLVNVPTFHHSKFIHDLFYHLCAPYLNTTCYNEISITKMDFYYKPGLPMSRTSSISNSFCEIKRLSSLSHSGPLKI